MLMLLDMNTPATDCIRHFVYYCMMTRGEMSEDSLKRCACITMNYVIDKLEIPPKNILL